MTNGLKKQVKEKIAAHIENWKAVPVIVNGIASYNFYRANLSNQHNTNKR